MSLVHDEDLVALDNRVKAMSYAKNSCSFEFLIDELLDGLLRDNINVGSGFIEHDEFVAPENGSDDADKLALAHA